MAAFTLAAFLFAHCPMVFATTVTLTWDPNSEPDLAGYRIYYGVASGDYSNVVQVARETTTSIESLETGRTYYFAATAYDVHGNESGYSNEVSYTSDGANLPPIAQNATLNVVEDLPSSGMLRAADPESRPLTFSVVAQPTRGTVSLTSAGTFTFTPGPNANGMDSFTYKANDGIQDSNVATIAVSIAPVNDPPAAVADQAAATAGTALSIDVLGNDRDVDGDALSIASVTQGKNGQTAISGKTVQYTSSRTFSGTDSFSYTITDGKGGTASAAVTVQVLSVNQPPVANNLSISSKVGSTSQGKLAATDPDGDVLVYSLVNPPSKGTATLLSTADGSFTYTAKAGATGSDTFTFKAADGRLDSNIATVTVNLSAGGRLVFAINAGGPQFVDSKGVVYQADRYFSGGSVYRNTLPIADTADDALYQTERFGTFGYNLPLPNGHYMVTLKMAEIYWGAAARRVFDILVEGREVASNLDLYASAGKARAYDLQIPARVTDGVLNLSFKADQDKAKLSGLTVTELGNDMGWGVNAGGGRYVDGAGHTFESDMLYSGGSTYRTTAPITGTEDTTLYQSERFGSFGYDIPVPNGVYQVTLKFAEIYWSMPGKRVFGVTAEGQEILKDFDLLTRVSPNESFDFPVVVAVTDGVLNLRFSQKLDQPKLSAVWVRAL